MQHRHRLQHQCLARLVDCHRNDGKFVLGRANRVCNSTPKDPECATVGVSCDSGPSLLLGRNHMSGGAEPNEPNTINDSCADGTVNLRLCIPIIPTALRGSAYPA